MPKTPISIRIDSDVLSWFRSSGARAYQSKINAVLRAYRDAEVAKVQIKVGRAQQIFVQYYARCFWHLKKDLQITPELIPVVQEGLRKNGGHEGLQLAETIDLDSDWRK